MYIGHFYHNNLVLLAGLITKSSLACVKSFVDITLLPSYETPEFPTHFNPLTPISSDFVTSSSCVPDA